MMVDAVIDLYLFSNLPSIAAQIFGSPDSDCTEHVKGETVRAAAHLYSDFHYFRPATGATINPAHTDYKECQGILPANHTKTSRLRMWITLDDDVESPPMINQSYFLSFATEEELKYFWAGEYLGIKAEDAVNEWTESRGMPSSRKSGHFISIKGLNRGDIVLHTPCLVHKSPSPPGRHVAFLCVTYAPAESKIHIQSITGAPFRGCKLQLQINEKINSKFDVCVPPAYPRIVKKGDVFNYEIEDDYSIYRATDMWYLWRKKKLEEMMIPFDVQ